MLLAVDEGGVALTSCHGDNRAYDPDRDHRKDDEQAPAHAPSVTQKTLSPSGEAASTQRARRAGPRRARVTLSCRHFAVTAAGEKLLLAGLVGVPGGTRVDVVLVATSEARAVLPLRRASVAVAAVRCNAAGRRAADHQRGE